MSISGPGEVNQSSSRHNGWLHRFRRKARRSSVLRAAITPTFCHVEHLETRTLLSTADPVPPTVTLVNAPPTSAFGSDYFFSVRYSDNVAINTTTIGNDDILVTGFGPGQLATLLNTTVGTDGSIIANYFVTAPPTTGAFTISMLSNTVFDTGANPVNPGALGSFVVDFPFGGVNQFPTGTITEAPFRGLSNTEYGFVITWRASGKIDAASIIDDHDIIVIGDNGYIEVAQYRKPTPPPMDAPEIEALYQIPAPSQTGTYNVYILPQDTGKIDWPGDLDVAPTAPLQPPAPYKPTGVLDIDDAAQGVKDTLGNYAQYAQIGQFRLFSAGDDPNNPQPTGIPPRVNPHGSPDLAASFLGPIQGKAAVGGTTTIPVRISNLGNGAASHIGVSLFASNNQAADADDTFLRQVFVSSLGGGKSKMVRVKINFGDLAPGAYFLAVETDKDTGVTEGNETNNFGFSQNPITVQAPFVDLTSKLIGALPDQVIGGTAGQTTLRVGNSGNTAFNLPLDVTLYASADGALDANDTVVASGTFPLKVAVGGTRDVKLTYLYPTIVPDGSYSLIANISGGASIGDPDASNNIAVSTERIVINKPVIDLVPTSVIIANAGGAVALTSGTNKVSVLIRDLGNVPVNGPITITVVAVPVSASTTSIPLATQSFNATVKLTTLSKFLLTFSLPATLASGSYFLKATVDPDNRFVETNELNNDVFSITPIQVIQTL